MARTAARRPALLIEKLEAREVLSGGGPSAQAQAMLESINNARANPATAADLATNHLDADVAETVRYYNVNLGQARNEIASIAPKAPLAWNQQLADAAISHSYDMEASGVQSHTGTDGSTPDGRIERAGYAGRLSSAENAFAYAESPEHAMQAFLIDWGVADKGHRRNILEPGVDADSASREIGIGIVPSAKFGFGPFVVTQNFGRRANAKAQLLGVAFDDRNGDRTYDVGEGRGDVTVQAKDLATGATRDVETWDAGGYQIELNPGRYRVTAKVGGRAIRTRDIEVGTRNVKFDVITSDAPDSNASDDNAQSAREQAAREQAAREQAARDQAAREQAAREQGARDQASREQAAREQISRDAASRELAARDQSARAARAAQDQAAAEQADRDRQTREASLRAGQGTGDAAFQFDWIKNWASWKAGQGR